MAALGVRALAALAPADLPRLDSVSLSWPVLGFAMGIAAVVAVSLGLITAARATAATRATPSRRAAAARPVAASQRVARAIVAAQLAITVVLLVGAALLGRSLLRVLSVDPGFRTDDVLAMDFPLPYADDPAAKARLAPFYAASSIASARFPASKTSPRPRPCRWTAACPTACSC